MGSWNILVMWLLSPWYSNSPFVPEKLGWVSDWQFKMAHQVHRLLFAYPVQELQKLYKSLPPQNGLQWNRSWVAFFCHFPWKGALWWHQWNSEKAGKLKPACKDLTPNKSWLLRAEDNINGISFHTVPLRNRNRSFCKRGLELYKEHKNCTASPPFQLQTWW